MKFIDDKSNNLSWWNRNYFYVGTFIFVVINILIYAISADPWDNLYLQYPKYEQFDITNLINSFIGNFGHGSWIHLFGNVLGTIIAGLYLERKMGSINFILLMFCGCILSSMAGAAISLTPATGFSGVTFFLYAIVLIDYIFSFEKSRRNKTNIILGAIILLYITIIGMCADLYYDNIVFLPWPNQLLTNSEHYGGFIVGLIVGFAINLVRLKMDKQSTLKLDNELKKGGNKAKKIVYSFIGVFMVVVTVGCISISVIAASRTSLTLNLYDLNRGYSQTYELTKSNNGALPEFLEGYVSNFEQSDEEMEKYIIEIYTDKDYQQKVTDVWEYSEIGYGYNLIYSNEDHIPLTEPTSLTYYLKSYKGHGIKFDNYETYCTDKIQESNLVTKFKYPINIDYYMLDFHAWDFVEENGTYKFKFENLKPIYSANDIYVMYIDQENIIHKFYADSEGYFTIPNVNNDLTLQIMRK